MLTYDIVIAGNGVIGLSTALALSLEDQNIKICIIGPNNNLHSASHASGAMLGCFGEVTSDSLKYPPNKQLLTMSLEARKLWPEWIETINQSNTQEPLKINKGTFIIHNSISGTTDDENFNAIITALEQSNEPYENVEPNDIPNIKPESNKRPLRSIYIPNEGSINSTELLSSLNSTIQTRKNISFINDEVVDVKLINSKISGVETAKSGFIFGNNVILCSGSSTQQLIAKIKQIRDRIPLLLSGVGTAFKIDSKNTDLPYTIRTPNRAGACGMHLLNFEKSSVYIGASNSLSIKPQNSPKVRDLYYLMKRAVEQFNYNFQNRNISNIVTGNRPVTIDTFPLIGKTSIPGLWIMTGAYRTGLHMSPYYAQYITQQLLLNVEVSYNIFQPERTVIQTLNKKDSVTQFINDYMSGAFEHEIKLPHFGLNQIFQEMIEQRVHNLYDKLETNIGLHSDILIMIELDHSLIPFFRNYLKTISQKPNNLENSTHNNSTDMILENHN